MGVCPKCGYEYEPHVHVCPECELELVEREEEPTIERNIEIDPELARQKLASVYRGYDEQSVRRIHAALRAEGVRAIVRSFQHPWLPCRVPMAWSMNDPLGAWGEVLVLERDAERAAEIIDVVQTGTIVADDMPESGEPP